MQFGNLSGLINGTEQVVFDYTVTGSAVSSVATGNILNGDEDGWYTVISMIVGVASKAINLLPNNDTTAANYGEIGIDANNTIVSSYASASSGGIYLGKGGNASQIGFGVTKFYAKSGVVRLFNTTTAYYISETTITAIYTVGHVWNNTVDNITNLTFVPAGGGDNIGVGSRFIILKSNNFTGGTKTGVITTPYIKGSWVRVGSTILGADASSVTFSGLDGDRDVIYSLNMQVKGSSNIEQLYMRFGDPTIDTGNNYGRQGVYCTNTAITGYRSANNNILLGNCSGAARTASFTSIIFAKQGFVRPILRNTIEDITSTTIGMIRVEGNVWNDTSGNLQTIEITLYQENFAVGSQFELYALRPNG